MRYKVTNIPWIEKVPVDWQVKTINSLFDERKEKVSDTEYMPLSVTKSGIVPQLDNVAKSDASDNRKKVLKGDFVINSRSDRKGSSGISEYDGSVSLISIVLTPREGYGGYWHYLLRSNDFIEEFYRNGKGIVADLWTTNYQSMKSIYLPVPPYDEQLKISNFLDWKISEINRLILVKKKKINLIHKLNQTVIDRCYEELDTKKSIRMKFLGDFLKTGSISRNDEEETTYKALLYGDLYTKYDYYFNSAETTVSEQAYSSNPKLKGNILFFTTSGELREEIGKCVLYSGDEEIAVGGDLLAFIPKDNINPKYLMYALNTTEAINYRYVESRGDIIVHISQNKIGDYLIKIPEIDKQNSFINKVENMIEIKNSSLENLQSEINILQKMKMSLISEVVTGKIKLEKIMIPNFETIELNEKDFEEDE